MQIYFGSGENMETISYPEILYHYTSIDSLALILKNRTIRLNTLDKMDDRQEQQAVEGNAFGKLIFVSSWTDEKKESIPMWKMYTQVAAGVRIGLRPMPFVRKQTQNPEYIRAFAPDSSMGDTTEFTTDTFLDVEDLCKQGVYSVDAFKGDILYQVGYRSEPELLKPQIVSKTAKGYNFALNEMGLYKNTHWDFQKEWRYRLCFFKVKYDIENLKMVNATEEEIATFSHGGLTPPFSYFDLEIAPHVYAQMEITPSPQMTPGNRILLETLIEKYNPSAKIVESELLGKI